MERREILQRGLLGFCFLAIGLLSVKLSIEQGVTFGALIFLFPAVLLFLASCIKTPLRVFFLLYIVTFFILGLSRYLVFPLPTGVVIDILLAFNFLQILIYYLFAEERVERLSFNPVLILSCVWMVYCLLEIFNPMTRLSSWFTSIRTLGIYIVAFQLLVFLVLNTLKKIDLFFTVWAFLAIITALKAIGQKYIGFDASESLWLYTSGAKTHVIRSGIRYFSFFTDAANFGCNMALSVVVFTILASNEKKFYRRILFIFVIILATYGFLISGTRAAVAVPFVGFTVWILLIKKWKWIVIGGGALALVFSLLFFTKIGHDISEIRRARTAFEFRDDASFNLRIENQAKMKSFMPDYPFGVGMGSAKNVIEGDLLFGLPTDSSMVFVWVETGIVGLILYIVLFAVVIGYGCYYSWFVLKDINVKNVVMASTAGISGMLIAGYANEVFHQLPTGPTIYILMGIIMISPYIDKQVNNVEQKV